MATIDSGDPLVAGMARRLADLRASLGLTLAQVSQQCGVTLQQIHKYETGRSAIPAAMIVRLANCLGAPAAYFFPDPPGEVRACRGKTSDRKRAAAAPEVRDHHRTGARFRRDAGEARQCDPSQNIGLSDPSKSALRQS